MEVFRVKRLCRSFCGKTQTVNRRNCWCAAWCQFWLRPHIPCKPTLCSQEQHMWTWKSLIWREPKKRKYWYVETCIPLGWYFGLWKFAFPRTFLFILVHSGKLVPYAEEVLLLDNQIKFTNTFVLHLCYKMRPQHFASLERTLDPFIVSCDFIKSPWKQFHEDLGVDARTLLPVLSL